MNLLRLLLTYAGFGFVLIGVIALAIPLVPTTPFLLLAGVCLARGSAKHRDWLGRMPLVGRYVSPRTKVAAWLASYKVYSDWRATRPRFFQTCCRTEEPLAAKMNSLKAWFIYLFAELAPMLTRLLSTLVLATTLLLSIVCFA